MRTLKVTIVLILAALVMGCQFIVESPGVTKAFKSPTTSDEVIRFTKRVASKSQLITTEVIGTSFNGIPLTAVKVANPDYEAKLKVLIFAQQHGNEHSGKEATLLLLSDISRNLNIQWLDSIELWIIPQLNPDGSDKNERRNAANLDLNRDHVVMQATETRALHSLFMRELPHVTLDLHEYQPYTDSWEKFGAYKTFDIQAGVPTNPNVSADIRKLATEQLLPAIRNSLNDKGFTFNNYIVGPVPTEGRTRHSTTDIDDGRQSFAILNTLSLIIEGINGRENSSDNLERRTYGQYETLTSILNYLHANTSLVMNTVTTAREKLKEGIEGEAVAVRMEHFPGDEPLRLNLVSSKTEDDTLVVIENYHPVVRPTLKIIKPAAYMVPRSDSLLISLLHMHQVKMEEIFTVDISKVTQWSVQQIVESKDEDYLNRFPQVVRGQVSPASLRRDYIYVSTSQLHGNFLVLLFEPQSMLGLAQRPGFKYLLEEMKPFPILRVEK